MKLAKLSLVAAMVLGALIACSNFATAQDTGKSAPKGKRGFSVEQQMEQMDKELKLTDTQKPKVKAFLEERNKKMAELRDVPQAERREKFQALREEQDKKLKEILTPDQFEKWQKFVREHRGGKKGPDADNTNGSKKANGKKGKKSE